MNIYFACSITGGRQDEDHYQNLVNALLADGHQVPTAGLASSEVWKLEGIEDPIVVYNRDIQWIRESDILIAEISTPSHGVGYEIGFALQLGKSVICLYQKGIIVSKMIIGNLDPKLTTYAYQDISDAIQFMLGKINNLQPQIPGQ